MHQVKASPHKPTDLGPITALILHATKKEVLCVQREGKQYLAMWTSIEPALAALANQTDAAWTMVAYETVNQNELFHTISGGVPGRLEGYVLNPNTANEARIRVARLPMAA